MYSICMEGMGPGVWGHVSSIYMEGLDPGVWERVSNIYMEGLDQRYSVRCLVIIWRI